MLPNSSRGTATSAICKIEYRPCETALNAHSPTTALLVKEKALAVCNGFVF